ncbi:tRNA pseudouridine(55) synthase TruB [Enterococcus dongliensis]|uniref:tRNA pseudouridine synthase B n=1 Tax=Enterococcus dongliensis TaxID=2559925 RepID=A0AAP5NDD7_9ENTE|nr:tRNA pseudouridine(55) synthase TruB [Enterococcus dongliensis]MDT2596977.1 tRNA pseudouridine(55) synthase TruB [Enterococcus dongliensis]MDT2602997.1 tRNA pseudouridine(55) synthase TruB [Enterococcus dongliensis]MDT2633341.1 tRNA pseudouridine(55) synthase TruB [Enterococcus dongliensis]MDT2636692.1 tRNA pseudouridine(55) synthase TruB [Enterococcus dongliensis]MDT2638811.1 tRNA pseudouridine(55) synthase TruB [Enterococcus dongliensis]
MDGILPLWKERGMTSHDCVFKLRKILQTKKVGHGGTLDPDVDGVLPICIGKGTKVIEYLQDSGKIYEGEITIGFSTTTEDRSGEVVETKAVDLPLTEVEIDQMMGTFIGKIKQVPPMYSAVKVNGKRLYEYARAGETIERPEREAIIEHFKRTTAPVYDAETKTQSWRFQVTCGKGTYVRTLAVDLGAKLGYPAHMSDLTRLASGGFSVGQAVTLAQVSELMEQNQIDHALRPIEEAMNAFPRINLTTEDWQKVKNGQVLPLKTFNLKKMPGELIAFFYQEQLVSLYKQHPEKSWLLKPSKVIRNEV